MRVASDGYIDLTDGRRVRTPGYHDHRLDPVPEEEAIAYLLSHSFRGHRRIVRPLSLQERKRIRLALWADSVSERMTLVDRVWRSITEPVSPPTGMTEPVLVRQQRILAATFHAELTGDDPERLARVRARHQWLMCGLNRH